MEFVPPRSSAQPGQPAAPPPVQPAPAPRPAEPRPPRRRLHLPGGDTFHSVISSATLIVSAFAIAIFLNTFVIQSYQVDGQSMENTLQNDDRLIVNKIPRTISRVTKHQYVPKRGEIIIFNQTGLPGFVGEKQLIKRVIGLPGEHVVVHEGKITVYNSQHTDGFNPDTSSGYHIDAPTTIGDVDVQLHDNELFVCGDNRGNSEDSRYFGPIRTDQVVAKLALRILPLNKAKSF